MNTEEGTLKSPMTTKWMSQPGSVMTGSVWKMHNTKRLEINPSFIPCVGEIPSRM